MAIGDAWAEGSFADSSFAVGAWQVGVAALAYTVQPTAVAITSSSVRARFTAVGTNPIDYGVAVLTDGAGVPTAADVLAGTVAGAIASLTGVTASSGAQETSSVLSGLTAETPYDMYVSIDDSVGSPILSTKVDFTTTAISSGGGIITNIVTDVISNTVKDALN